MFDPAAALIYGSFIGITAISLGTILKPFINSLGNKNE